jgi:hypothetical protein
MRSTVSAESRAARSLFHLKKVERGGAPSSVRSSSALRPQRCVMLKNAVSAVEPSSSESRSGRPAGRGCSIAFSPVMELS